MCTDYNGLVGLARDSCDDTELAPGMLEFLNPRPRCRRFLDDLLNLLEQPDCRLPATLGFIVSRMEGGEFS